MRTIIYVDGYNLYYSMLTKTKHKWIDIHKLFTHCIVKTIEPKSDVICLKYFTSPIKANYCSDPEAPNRQRKYHNALEAVYGDKIKIIYGNHQEKETKFIISHGEMKGSVIRGKTLEEKKTDVNLSIQMYRDVCSNKVDQIVLVSNDSDFAPAISAIREDFCEMKIGVVLPGYPNSVRKSKELTNVADWHREYIRLEELIAAQMPPSVQNRKNKTIRKPDVWY